MMSSINKLHKKDQICKNVVIIMKTHYLLNIPVSLSLYYVYLMLYNNNIKLILILTLN